MEKILRKEEFKYFYNQLKKQIEEKGSFKRIICTEPSNTPTDLENGELAPEDADPNTIYFYKPEGGDEYIEYIALPDNEDYRWEIFGTTNGIGIEGDYLPLSGGEMTENAKITFEGYPTEIYHSEGDLFIKLKAAESGGFIVRSLDENKYDAFRIDPDERVYCTIPIVSKIYEYNVNTLKSEDTLIHNMSIINIDSNENSFTISVPKFDIYSTVYNVIIHNSHSGSVSIVFLDESLSANIKFLVDNMHLLCDKTLELGANKVADITFTVLNGITIVNANVEI